MLPSEYEEYVAQLVLRLEISPDIKIYRNRKFKGLRQPGEYEIDIAAEINIEEALQFLLIVECKNWQRPIDRPVIQKFAQTRDAIGAHKAIVASPIGFTSEAISVAKVHGVALWVASEDELRPVLKCVGLPRMDDFMNYTCWLTGYKVSSCPCDGHRTWRAKNVVTNLRGSRLTREGLTNGMWVDSGENHGRA
jgi:hypothetical protein